MHAARLSMHSARNVGCAHKAAWARNAARVVLALWGCALGASLASACSQVGGSAALGAECYSTLDCRPGLTCVPQPGDRRICSGDLSTLVPKPTEPGAEAGAPDANSVDSANPDAAPIDANAADARSMDSGPVDSGAADTGLADTGLADTGRDTGNPADSGADARD